MLLAVAGARWPGDDRATEPPAALVPTQAAAVPRRSSCTSQAQFGSRGSTSSRRARIADAIARAGGATAKADTAAVNLAAPLADGMQVLVPRRVAGAAGAAAGAGGGGRAVSLSTRDRRGARRAARHRPRHRSEDRRLPGQERRLPLGRPPRRDPRHRPRADRAAARPGDPVIERAGRRCSSWRRASGSRAANLVRAPGARRAVSCVWRWPSSPRLSCAALPACALALALGRLVVGQRAARRARAQRARGRGRTLGAVQRRRDRPGPPNAFALRVPGEMRRFDRAPSASGCCSSCRSDGRLRRAPCSQHVQRRRSARSERRLRRARVARSARRSRRAARRRLADRRSPRRPRRFLRPAPAHVARAVAAGLDGERRAVLAGIVLGEDEGLDRRAAGQLQGLGALPPAGGVGAERRVLALGVLRARVAARHLPLVGAAAALSWRSPATSSPSGGSRPSSAPASPARSPRSPGCVARPRDRWHFLALGARRCSPGRRPPCSSPASSSRSPRWPRSSSWCRGSTGRSRVTRCPVAARGARGLDRVRRSDRADPLAPVRQRAALLAARQTSSPRARWRRCSGSRCSARSSSRCCPSAALALALAERLARGVHRGLRASSSAACLSPQLGSGAAVARAARHAARVSRPAPPAALAAPARARVRAIVPALLVWQLWPTQPRRHRPGCGSRSSTSARATPSCSQVPEGALLVDQGPPEAEWRGSCAISASAGSRRSC